MAAEGKVGLMMNVSKSKLADVIAILQALKKPTISHLSDDDWLAVSTIIEESMVRQLIPQLKNAGASGIVEYPISKIID
jgi:ATP phosphoribosyltransferase